MMLSILSCVCWQSVYLLWRNVYLGLLPIFGLGCLFFWYWAAGKTFKQILTEVECYFSGPKPLGWKIQCSCILKLLKICSVWRLCKSFLLCISQYFSTNQWYWMSTLKKQLMPKHLLIEYSIFNNHDHCSIWEFT